MLTRLKRWLGWDSDSDPFDFEDLQEHTLSRPNTAARRPSPSPQAPQPPPKVAGDRKPAAATRPPNRTRSAAEVLDNPELDLSAPPDAGFDPYNTGAFNRSASWDRISKNRGR